MMLRALYRMMKEEPGYIQRVNGDSILIPSTTKFVEHALRKHFPDIKVVIPATASSPSFHSFGSIFFIRRKASSTT